MSAIRLIGACVLAILCWLMPIQPAQATGNSCSVTGATTASIGNYDPFTGSSFTQVPVTLTLNRFTSGSKKTQRVDFYLVQPAGSQAGYAITYQSSNVLYTLPATYPLTLPSPPASGTVFYNFGGNASPDSVSLVFLVTIPPGVNLSAGAPITFDIVYICDGTGGLNGVSTPTTLPGAITIQINVVSALQARYAGSALNFGELGGVSNAQASTHSVAGMIRVASTGPYTVTLSGGNGYQMTYPGGNLGTSAQTIKYSARFLGQTMSNAAPTFATVACSPAGIGGQNLPLTLALSEGGQTKTAAPNYRDTLVVTVTPLAVPFNGQSSACATLQ
jgi:spore coat protein U-like protein